MTVTLKPLEAVAVTKENLEDLNKRFEKSQLDDGVLRLKNSRAARAGDFIVMENGEPIVYNAGDFNAKYEIHGTDIA